MKIQAIVLAGSLALSGLNADTPSKGTIAPTTNTSVHNETIQDLGKRLTALQTELKAIKEELKNPAPMNSHSGGRALAAVSALMHFWNPWVSYGSFAKTLLQSFATGNLLDLMFYRSNDSLDTLDWLSLGVLGQVAMNEAMRTAVRAGAILDDGALSYTILSNILIVVVPLWAKFADSLEIYGPNTELRKDIQDVLAEIENVKDLIKAQTSAPKATPVV